LLKEWWAVFDVLKGSSIVRVGLSERFIVTNQFNNWRGSAAAQCGRPVAFRSSLFQFLGGYASSSEAQPQKDFEGIGAERLRDV
jgi:hypothetical protein